jgi:hypothetical protein
VSAPGTASADLRSIPRLPDLFVRADGTRLSTRSEWGPQRDELSALIQRHELGPYPPPVDEVQGRVAGGALRVALRAGAQRASFAARIQLPAGPGPFPAFVLINGTGLGADALLERGIACIELPATAIAVDRCLAEPGRTPIVLREGVVYDLFGKDVGTGALMAWGWAVHRIVDALCDVRQIDVTRIGVSGFSRWGKAALVAGAFDERIALTAPSSSGQAGVGSFRAAEGTTGVQTIGQIAEEAPHWFGDGFPSKFGRSAPGGSQRIPVDSHSTLALVAPRPLIATEGSADAWNYPPGPVIAMEAAREVYRFLGAEPRIGLRQTPGGGHVLSPDQCDAVLAFADRYLLGRDDVDARVFDDHEDPQQSAALRRRLLPWASP